MEIYTLHFDGSCAPTNPGGTAAFGFVLRKTGIEEPLEAGHGVIGTGDAMSNNLAEFHALRRGLEAFEQRTVSVKRPLLDVYGDSNLVIQIMNRKWRPTPTALYYPAYVGADTVLRRLRRDGATVWLSHVRRENNQECDVLSKRHLTSVP